MADTLNRMEKRGIIESADQWRRFREIRNAFAYNYPEADATRVQAINQAWHAASVVLDIAQQVNLYCELPTDVAQWLIYADSRVGTSHDYDGEKAKAALDLMGDFVKDVVALYEILTSSPS